MKAKQFIHELEHGSKLRYRGDGDILIYTHENHYQMRIRSTGAPDIWIYFDHAMAPGVLSHGYIYLWQGKEIVGMIYPKLWEVEVEE